MTHLDAARRRPAPRAALAAKAVLRLERGDEDRRVFIGDVWKKTTSAKRFGRHHSAGREGGVGAR